MCIITVVDINIFGNQKPGIHRATELFVILVFRAGDSCTTALNGTKVDGNAKSSKLLKSEVYRHHPDLTLAC